MLEQASNLTPIATAMLNRAYCTGKFGCMLRGQRSARDNFSSDLKEIAVSTSCARRYDFGSQKPGIVACALNATQNPMCHVWLV